MYFLCRYCIRLCSQTCHLVGSSQARHWWVAGVAHTGPVWKCQMQSACWLQPEWRVQCESGHSPRLLLEPLTVHHVLEALSLEFRTGCPWENLYADGLVIITELLEKLQQKLILWKTTMEGKRLQVNMGRTKVLIPGPGLNVLQKSGKTPVACVSRASAQFCFLWWLFQLDPQEMQWHPWLSEVWCQLQV